MATRGRRCVHDRPRSAESCQKWGAKPHDAARCDRRAGSSPRRLAECGGTEDNRPSEAAIRGIPAKAHSPSDAGRCGVRGWLEPLVALAESSGTAEYTCSLGTGQRKDRPSKAGPGPPPASGRKRMSGKGCRVARGRGWLCAAAAASVALVGAVMDPMGASAATGTTAVDAAELALLRGAGNPAAAVSPEDAAAAHAEFLRRLGAVQAAVQGCDAFLDRFGSNTEVARVLNRVRQKPGELFHLPGDRRGLGAGGRPARSTSAKSTSSCASRCATSGSAPNPGTTGTRSRPRSPRSTPACASACRP